MSDRLQSSYYDRAVDHGAQNRVLRNTYWLLAASLVPTVLGDYEIGRASCRERV